MASNGERASEGRASGGGAPSHFLEHEWVLWEHRAPASSKDSSKSFSARFLQKAAVESAGTPSQQPLWVSRWPANGVVTSNF